MIYHINIGRYTIGFFPYWIGISWRYLKSMGRILDLGFLKIVRWPAKRPISAGDSKTSGDGDAGK